MSFWGLAFMIMMSDPFSLFLNLPREEKDVAVAIDATDDAVFFSVTTFVDGDISAVDAATTFVDGDISAVDAGAIDATDDAVFSPTTFVDGDISADDAGASMSWGRLHMTLSSWCASAGIFVSSISPWCFFLFVGFQWQRCCRFGGCHGQSFPT